MKKKKELTLKNIGEKLERFRQQYEYLPDEKLPVLCLAVKMDFSFDYVIYEPEEYKFKNLENYKFIKIAHQTGGYACHQHYMIGTILKSKRKTLLGMNEISKIWLDSCCGMGGMTSLDELNKYRKQLNKLLDVDCNRSYYDFEEGLYPIDCTVENIKKLAHCPKLPKQLDDFIEWKSDFQKLGGCLGRWKLFILGENCD